MDIYRDMPDENLVKILIGGDVYPGSQYSSLFSDGNCKGIFGDLLKQIDESDFSVVNLESPLITQNSPIVKSGAILGANSTCINGLKSAGFDLVNLANNHILDHGVGGIAQTVKICQENNIFTVGVGRNEVEASKVFIANIKKKKIGFIGIAEHEFSVATRFSWGAAPLDLICNSRTISENKKKVDYLIVLLHAGNEHYPYPSPRLKNICHFFAENGADAIIVQHTHCVGCYERFKGTHIVYGQGNFVFFSQCNKKSFFEGILIKLSLNTKNQDVEIDFIPFKQSYQALGVREMDPEDKEMFFREFEERSQRVLDDDFLHNRWLDFCLEKRNEYVSYLRGHGRILTYLNKIGFIGSRINSNKLLTSVRNVVLCEAHREVLETLFYNNLIK
ncbi:MAG: CapA family protein [Pseudomonadota bacterium]